MLSGKSHQSWGAAGAVRWPVPLPSASLGKGGVEMVRAHGLLQLLLVCTSDVWPFNFNCVREAPLKSKMKMNKQFSSSSEIAVCELEQTTG